MGLCSQSPSYKPGMGRFTGMVARPAAAAMASLALVRGGWAARPWTRARLAVMDWRVLAGMQASAAPLPALEYMRVAEMRPRAGLVVMESWPGQGSGVTDNLTSGLAGYFGGPVNVNGNLAKAGGSFVIDHPTDPANKYLYHSFVESPDMKNIYDGNVVTDGSGTAVVKMPDWFEALNRDFRYQLTVIGQFAQAIVASKIANGQFAIKTDKPGVEVSWQVTGIRQDAWANAHRVPGEPDLHELHHPRPVKKQP